MDQPKKQAPAGIEESHSAYLIQERLGSVSQSRLDPETLSVLLNSLIRLGQRCNILDLALRHKASFKGDGRQMFALLDSIIQTGNLQLVSHFHTLFHPFMGRNEFLYLFAIFFKNIGDTALSYNFFHRLGKNPDPVVLLYLLEMVRNQSSKSDCQHLESKFKETTQAEIDADWLLYQLSRYCDISSRIKYLKAEVATTITARKLPFAAFHARHGREVLASENIKLHFLPRPDPAILKTNIKRFITLITASLEDEKLSFLLSNIKQTRAHYAQKLGAPVQIISAGRAGTTALYDLLDMSHNFKPYHSFMMQTLPGERLELLARLRSGIFDSDYAIATASQYLKRRNAEILYAYRTGKRPVFINHWDSIYSLVNLAVFPDLKLLYLERNPMASAKSFIGKLQWQYIQLYDAPCIVNSREEDKFLWSQNTSDSLGHQVAWYLFITRVLGTEAGALCRDGNFLSLSSDDLFASDEDSLERLLAFIGASDIKLATAVAHYKKPVNVKAEREQYHIPPSISAEIEKVPGLFQEFCDAYFK